MSTHIIRAKNVNKALFEGLWWLHVSGSIDDSRNGRVLVAPGPVITEYINPAERVLFSPERDANPFFHLMESMWMLAGRNDVEFPAYYAANLAQFSDNGTTLHGAYGYRWRHAMGYDQLPVIINELSRNPKSRRCVLQMWDASESIPCQHDGCNDLNMAMTGGKDVPCNTQAYFDTLGGRLNMTVCNRSNDAIWGCYGANVVHFSVLHEFIALGSGLPLGTYRQFSNNFHIYADRPDVQRLHTSLGAPMISQEDCYTTRRVKPYPLMQPGELAAWMNDLETFFDRWQPGMMISSTNFTTGFWREVIAPINNAHLAHKRGDYIAAEANLEHCMAEDWRLACMDWINRRKEKRNAKAN